MNILIAPIADAEEHSRVWQAIERSRRIQDHAGYVILMQRIAHPLSWTPAKANVIGSPEQRAWVEQWPNYCRKCSGTGFVGPGGYDSETGFPLVDACPCTNAGRCPRCGEPGLTSEERGDDTTGEGPCTFCKWDCADGGIPGIYAPDPAEEALSLEAEEC